MERFDEAILLSRELPEPSYWRENVWDDIFQGLCCTGQKNKGLDFLQESGMSLHLCDRAYLLQKYYHPGLPDVDTAMYERLKTILLSIYKKNEELGNRLDPLKGTKIFERLAETFYGFDETETAWQAYQKAVSYTVLIPKEEWEYRNTIRYLAKDIIDRFGSEKAEDAYCRAITVLKDDRPHDLVNDVLDLIEDYIYRAHRFNEKKKESYTPTVPTPDEWKDQLLHYDFYIDH
jgi:hypothetical protein